MSTGKLIFSFGTGFNLALDRTHLADGSIMKFGMGFENLKMTSDGLTFTTVDHEVLAETICCCYVSSVATRPVVVANTKIEPSLKLKSVITAVEPIQSEVLKPNDQFFSAPTVFEIGSSSSGAPLTKTQRRKKNRRIRKIHERLSRERELAEIEFVGADGQYVLPETSSLLRGSRFHPLSAAQGEEDVRKIANSPPRPFQYESEPARKKKSPFSGVRAVIQRMASKEGRTAAEVFRQMGCAVSENVKSKIFRSERTKTKVLVQATQKDRRKYVDQSATYAQVDRYERRPKRHNSKRSDEIVLTGSGQSRQLAAYAHLSRVIVHIGEQTPSGLAIRYAFCEIHSSLCIPIPDL
ncbi:hypothetical protein IEQ34_023176 [Dendrobium chrysotoxum]|uniref:Uncharacterized protein n=1 Tax=Dendrobium chrysotoxum TaxID=161865 RepID=A0AAV7FS04_DENCH|nr:hypothetical protein IEQ34_025343 [Dendrobium chrysotoxum]KAH0446102.1 hypothetical protein IEQ34_025066 [Dendrobium chrysotoxum]KAH0447466.1 hypothetical protein IEQ34_023689 [Dendrobium chrysotoxum]KAH0447867.1 hypothetical protein IEQ34_023301 [Dendrobium chrysotoxum]KAH0447993.1 hypothetical protein IEQ34_023176 [Dendrobium chrysotoxum]